MTAPVAEPGVAIRLARRPEGTPTMDCFDISVQPAPQPGDAEVLVRNSYISVDPYMRGRMSDAKSYVAPFELDEIMVGEAVGVVYHSDVDSIPVGATVTHHQGWRTYAAGAAKEFRVVDASQVPASAYLGALGMPGMTAYIGMRHIAQVREGDKVFVSAAAGAVGSVAGQIARLCGASRVVGSAGSPEKIAHLVDELGYDAAFNYKDGDIRRQLRSIIDRIDVYFDNVGGEQLEAAISTMAQNGRIALCGAISVYNATSMPPGPRNLTMLIGKRLTLRGFLVSDHESARAEFEREMTGWVVAGSLHLPETVVDGVANAPEAFLGLLRGENTGKMLIRVESGS
jgi:NADPH-dependent curcumin reductase CurA